VSVYCAIHPDGSLVPADQRFCLQERVSLRIVRDTEPELLSAADHAVGEARTVNERPAFDPVATPVAN